VANEVVFLLRFDTKAGEQQVRQLSTQARAQLTKAFSIAPKSVSLSDALGIKAAVTDVTKLQSAITKLDVVMNKSIRESNRSITNLKPGRILHEDVTALGLDEAGIRARVAEQEARIRGRFKGKSDDRGVANVQGRVSYRDPVTGRFATFSAGGERVRDRNKLNSEELIRLQQFEAKIRKNQIAQIQRAANAVAQADKERIEARQSEARAIRETTQAQMRALKGVGSMRDKAIADAMAVFGSQKRGGFADVYGMAEEGRERLQEQRKQAAKAFANEKRAGRTVEGESLEDFMPGVRRTKYDAERRRVADERRNSAEIVKSEREAARAARAKEAFDKIAEPERLFAKKYRTEKAKEFASTGRGAPSVLGALFGERSKTFEEFLG